MGRSYSQSFRFYFSGWNFPLRWIWGLWLLPIITFSQPVTFNRERIEVSVINNLSWVKGTYHFVNHGPLDIRHSIYYPFSSANHQSKPLSISVNDLNNQTAIPFTELSGSALFSLLIPGNDEKIFQVVYCQAVPDSTFEYILTTTAAWHKPLEHAEYVVTLHNGYRLKSITLPYDYQSVRGDSISYFITRENFMPDTNLEIKWEGNLP